MLPSTSIPLALALLFLTLTVGSMSTGNLRHDDKVKMMMGGMMGLERTVARAPDARGRIYGPRPSDLQMSGGSVGGMPGGWTSQEVNDQGVQKAAKVRVHASALNESTLF